VSHLNPNDPATRASNYARLHAYYRVDPAAEDATSSVPVRRFALAMIESRAPTSDSWLTTVDSFADACALAGEGVLDSGRTPDAVYDLDTGQRIELHTTTPVVTRSEDQGVMVNPLAGEEKPDVQGD
jgi:hypothetical protein